MSVAKGVKEKEGMVTVPVVVWLTSVPANDDAMQHITTHTLIQLDVRQQGHSTKLEHNRASSCDAANPHNKPQCHPQSIQRRTKPCNVLGMRRRKSLNQLERQQDDELRRSPHRR